MSRPLRIEFDGAYYHVLSRGNEQRNIFRDKDDRFSFLETLGNMSERFEVEVYAYVLMDNHYHLLIKTNRANISKSMQWFGATYTQRYNIRNKRSGHLFQGRFKSFLIENDEYLMLLSCYIHRNPIRAGIVRRLADYPWSSYPAYAYGKKAPVWLLTKPILSFFDTKDKHMAYRKMVQGYSGEEDRIWEDFRHGLFLGSERFIDRIKAKYLSEDPDIEIPQKRQVQKDTNPANILKKGAKVLKYDTDTFSQSSRISETDRLNRDLLIYLLWSTGWYTNKEIGQLFGLGYSSISRRVTIMKQEISKDDKLKKKIKMIKSQIKT